MTTYFKTENLAVGYNGNILIGDINISLETGKILTLIGPNGAGKSTILKSITGQLETIGGSVYIGEEDITSIPSKTLAQNMAVVLTERIRPELMTCAEVVAMGRYPYTNMFGKLTKEDEAAVREALERVHALSLAEQDFLTLSDGQRQRIMLARAICQEPKILVLDEPTAYLDIRYKVEILEILKELAKSRGTTIIMSLHEIDLAMKTSDLIVCVKGENIAAFGTPDEIMANSDLEKLYEMEEGSFNPLLGSVELAKPKGEPRAFVIAGCGAGIPVFRRLQRMGIPFATGIVFENDVDYQVAKALSESVISNEAFESIEKERIGRACEMIEKCGLVIDTEAPMGSMNRANEELVSFAKSKNIKIIKVKDIENEFYE